MKKSVSELSFGILNKWYNDAKSLILVTESDKITESNHLITTKKYVILQSKSEKENKVCHKR